jgi:hypothetical protein
MWTRLNRHCLSARCAYAANAVGKDLDIFAIGAVSLYHIYTLNLKLLILFVHTPDVLCYVILVTSHLCLFAYFLH